MAFLSALDLLWHAVYTMPEAALGIERRRNERPWDEKEINLIPETV